MKGWCCVSVVVVVGVWIDGCCGIVNEGQVLISIIGGRGMNRIEFIRRVQVVSHMTIIIVIIIGGGGGGIDRSSTGGGGGGSSGR